MNAAEIIEEIARLPESEKGKVIDFVRHLPNAETLEAIHEPAENLPRHRDMNEVLSAIMLWRETSSVATNVTYDRTGF